MLRLIAAFLLVQLVAQATGLVYAAGDLACEDSSSEGRDADGTSTCEDCLCCPHHRLLVSAPHAAVTILASRALEFSRIVLRATDPAPGEIMHVPKTEPSAAV